MEKKKKNDYDLATKKFNESAKLKKYVDKNTRLSKALRDNLKKRKVQAKTRKITKDV